jgi:Recombination, repair and ssDNA binding protein UvsY
MTINEILNQWEIDSVINKAQLSDESLKSSKLHSKYMNILVRENLKLAKVKTEYNAKLMEKYILYTEGAHDLATQKAHPYLPKSGKVLKSEVDKYLNADADMIEETLKVANQQEKVDLLRSILKSIEKRSFDIKNSVDHQKFMAGGN